jgi:CRP-like cAMP-binding protein
VNNREDQEGHIILSLALTVGEMADEARGVLIGCDVGRAYSGAWLMIDAEATERFMAAPWLAEVDRDTKRAIASALVEARAPAGSTLLEQGQPNDHLTFLIAGTAEIVRSFGITRRDIITDLTAPAVFGTTSFFQPKPPTVSVRATSDVWVLSLYHPAHEALRTGNPRAAEALALAVVRALSERFDLIDKLFTDFTKQHSDEPAKMSEWAGFRSRLFEERGI